MEAALTAVHPLAAKVVPVSKPPSPVGEMYTGWADDEVRSTGVAPQLWVMFERAVTAEGAGFTVTVRLTAGDEHPFKNPVTE